ncbi:hypothetical protein [Halovivax gelatinilyticus]|uniref:hypothetical protein n=1 Tax=Halovivax gelatinilyticus TaxID=2961597 RepID=UPI0020CA7667|nr:hypothetical protein [Halovivax gelatinilyticus]
MVDERITDGVRIAELLSSEVDGRTDGPLGPLSVTNPDPDVEPTVNGERAFDLDRDGDRIASVFVHPDRAHVAIRNSPDLAHEAASTVGLRTRPKATKPPQTLVFVESGAEVKRATEVLEAVAKGETDGGGRRHSVSE